MNQRPMLPMCACFVLFFQGLLVPGAVAEETIEEITVVGYHVRRGDTEGPAPVVIIEREAMQAAAHNTLAEVARGIPANVQGISDGGSRNIATSGTAQFNLRGLGVDATLVLINGKRVSPHGQGQFNRYFVDLNSIPVAVVERVEVLKDGASSLYGSDALAGVVNVVLRDQIDGVELEVGTQTAVDGSFAEYFASLVGGLEVGNGSLVAAVSAYSGDPFYSRDNAQLADFDFTDRGGQNDRPFTSSPPTMLFFDAASPIGFRVVPDAECGSTAETSVIEVIPGLWSECGFNPATTTTQIAESDRYGVALFADWPVSDSLDYFVDLTSTHNVSTASIAPTPISGTPLDTPFNMPLVPDFHPDNPLGVPLLIGYRSLPSGVRKNEVTTDLSRLVTGLRGNRSDWAWELSGQWSRSNVRNYRRNFVHIGEFQNALLGAGGPAANEFFNPFGIASQSQSQVVDQFTVDLRDGARSEELSLDFGLTGTLSRWREGPVRVAAGLQYRRLDLDQSLDPLEAAGMITGGFPRYAVSGNRNIVAVYGEAGVKPFSSLELQLALRTEHYDDFGTATNPKVGFSWQPASQLRIRGTWGTSFRAPSIPELYEPLDEFIDLAIDTVRCEVTGDVTDCAELPYPVSTQGNPQLDAEQGESWSLGVQLTPFADDRMQLDVDLWEVSIDERILLPGQQFFVDNFGDDPAYVMRSDPTPEDIALGIPGRIESIRTIYMNAQETTARGLDLHIAYSIGNDWQLLLDHTYLNEYRIIAADDSSDYAGRTLFVFASMDVPLPRNRSNLSLRWTKRSFETQLTLRYLDGFISPRNHFEQGVDTGNPFGVDSWTTLDANFAIDIGEQSSLRIGCRNCLDQKVPVTNSFIRGAPYDYRGAMANLRLTVAFD